MKNGLIASCLGLLMSLLLVEGVVRLGSLLSKPKEKWNTRPSFYFGAEGNPTLQNLPYPTEKPEQEFRVAVVGDSYSFAPFMQFTDAFPAVMERMLNLNKTTRKARVINYGVPAYSTSHEVAVVDQAIKEKADLIILQITLNDAELKPFRPTGIGNFGDKFGPFAPTGTLKTVTEVWTTLGFILSRIHNTRTYQAYADYFIDLFENPKSFGVFKNSSETIISKAKAANIPLVAVVFPLFGTPLDNNYPFHDITKKVMSVFEEREVFVLNLFSPFKNIPLDVIQVIPGEDRHPNELGHRIAAEEIYEWLVSKNLIPEDLRIKERFLSRTGIANMPREYPREYPRESRTLANQAAE